MDTKGIEVLHVTDCDTIIIAVSYNFILHFLPSLEALLYQYLGRKREGFTAELI
jgi:hypothetical protein